MLINQTRNCYGGKIISKRQLLLTFLMALTVLMCVSAASASDVNVTDSHAIASIDTTSSVHESVDDSLLSTAYESDVLESVNSNNLSTNQNKNSSSDVLKTGSIPANKTVVSQDLEKYYKGSESHKATFYDLNGNPLVNTKIGFTIKCSAYTKTYYKLTDANGVASLAIGLNPGDYQIVSQNLVTGYNLTNTIKVLSTIESSDLTKYYKGSKDHTAKFYNSDGTPLVNRDVKFTIKGSTFTKTYTKTTNKYGFASLAIGLSPGTYQVISKDPVTGWFVTNTITILPTVVSSDVTKYYKGSKGHTAKFYTSEGAPLANKEISFTLKTSSATKTYTKKTDANGVASLAIGLNPGTYQIVSNDPYTGYKVTTTVKVLPTINASDITKVAADNKKFYATFLDGEGNPLANADVKFKVNGKTYNSKTNANGVAGISLSFLKAGNYKIISYNVDGSSKTNNVNVLAHTTTELITSPYTFVKGEGNVIKVTLRNGLGYAPNAGKVIKITIGSTTYSAKTDSNGVASFTLPTTLEEGIYTVKYTYAGNSYYTGSSASNKLTFYSTSTTHFTVKGSTIFYIGEGGSLQVVLKSGNLPLAGKTVVFKLGSVSYTKVTDKDGVASLPIGLAYAGNYTFSFEFAGEGLLKPSSSSTVIQVKKMPDSISIKNIISGAKTVKEYFEKYNKYPTSVTAGGITFTLPQFVYLMSQAIYKIGNSNYKDVVINKDVAQPASPTSGDYFDYEPLYKKGYLQAANTVAKYANDNKKLPNYITTDIGKICHNEYVDAFARILAYYGNNNELPSYVSIVYRDSSVPSPAGKGLNQKNTGTDLAKYLKATMNCQVDNAKIKAIVDKVTKGLSSVKDKAVAIYNYVRDYIDYAFYYDTKHGAVGTLEVGSGNCVDQAHLLVAMLRTADIPARYVHGTCTFSSGSTYGHVWAQVLIGDIWYVADPTSSRNSFGKIVNWNTKSYTVHTITNEITF